MRKKTTKAVVISLASKIVSAVPLLFTRLTGLFYNEPEQIIMRLLSKGLENKRIHIAYKIMPWDSLDIPVPDLGRSFSSENMAIVLQGPIPDHVQFILNTVRFYKKLYSGSKIIVSTWADEPAEKIKAVEAEGALVIANQKPVSSGIRNINYQLVSSRAGIQKAKELGCEYAVKTRTDQRFCKPYLFCNMRTVAEKIHPVPCSPQHARLVVLANSYHNMFSPYYMSDFLYFGHIEDMQQLFAVPLDEREPFEMPEKASRRAYAQKMFAPEMFILKHYLHDKLGYDCKDTIEAYWEAVKNYLICYSFKEADLLWPKYSGHYELNQLYGDYFGKRDSPERMSTMYFDFQNWLSLYCGTITYNKAFERYADAPLILDRVLQKNKIESME